MLNIAVRDDFKMSVKQLKMLIDQYRETRGLGILVTEFDSGEALCSCTQTFDMIFLDIDMGGMNGIEAAREIRKRDKKVKIIYVTSYREYVGGAFAVHAFSYLLKPVDTKQIFKVLDEAIEYSAQEETEDILDFVSDEGNIHLALRDIYYFEYESRRIRMVTQGHAYWLRQKMSELSLRMAAWDFVMPHKSFCVNLYHVKSVRGYEVFMNNGDVLPLSQKKAVEFRQELNGYMARRMRGTDA